ncbi:MAG: PEP-CTERM sorting domain-containing protein [Desulfobacula sp.]|jgi:hypothetical protein
MKIKQYFENINIIKRRIRPMKKLMITSFMLLMVLCFAQVGSASTIGLYEYAFNLDDNVYDYINGTTITYGDFPAGVNGAVFDTTTGIGTIAVTISGTGSHYFGAFFDHEIDEAINTFSNEYGSVSGSPATGQSWEIDEPGYVFGDIYSNFAVGILDNFNGVPSGFEDDVSMAMGWDFILGAGDTAYINLVLSTIAPSGFYLTHTDPDSGVPTNNIGNKIYFSSSLNIRPGGGIPEIPEPSTMILFGIGLLGFAKVGRKN